MSDRVLRNAPVIAEQLDVLEAEWWASGWLGQAWVTADPGEREPERQLCLEVVGRASTRPSAPGLAAVAALGRVAPANQISMLNGTVTILAESQPAPPWLASPVFTPVRAWRAVDVWDSERVLFVAYESTDPHASEHTLLAQILEPGGTMIAKLALLHTGAAHAWTELREPDEVPMPLIEQPVDVVLADLAATLRKTDMYWPRPDDEDFVEIRALAWTRCRDHLPDWPEPQEMSDDQRRELIDAFLTEADLPGGDLPSGDLPSGDLPSGDLPSGDLPSGTDVEVVRSLADLFCDYGEGYIAAGPLAWSPEWVGLFLTDWLPRKAFLDPDQRAALPGTLRRWLGFTLRRRGVDAQWIVPVVGAVDIFLPEFAATMDDESSWGPAKQIAAELTARGVDPTDKTAVEAVISELNAVWLAQRLIDKSGAPQHRR